MWWPSPISLIFRLKDLCCKTQLMANVDFLRLQGLGRNLKYKIGDQLFFFSCCFLMADGLTSTHARPTDDVKRNVVLTNVFWSSGEPAVTVIDTLIIWAVGDVLPQVDVNMSQCEKRKNRVKLKSTKWVQWKRWRNDHLHWPSGSA